jgi:RNA polymerase sigma-70 factor (ECF subfamily)
LIDQCLAGDAEAFGELVRPYQDRLYNTLYRILGSRDDAAEALQDGLVRAFRRLGSFHRESSFYTWLYRVAVNVALSRRRRRRRRPTTTDLAGVGELAGQPELGDPSRNMEARERRRMIEEALAGVPEVFRVALVLKEIDGLKYEEIARVLRLPVGTVRSRLHRARNEMRIRLKPLIDAGVI